MSSNLKINYSLSIPQHYAQAAFQHETVQGADSLLLKKWVQLGFDEQIFHKTPDLVNFVFDSHLHRHIKHPRYNHSILMKDVVSWKEGKVVVEKHPHLLMDGRYVAWSEIRKKIKVDKEGCLYSEENGQKKRWDYLDEGLTQWDKNKFDTPRRFYRLNTPPSRSRVELVTTHAHPKDLHLGDRVLKGTRHSFFRFVPGKGFAQKHPETGLEEGAVYSLGWSARWRDFSLWRPFSTLVGTWFCPDSFEFKKEDQYITPIEVDDAFLIKLLDLVKKRNHQGFPFHPTNANCCKATSDLFRDAGIVQIDTKAPLSSLLYKLFVPKTLRRIFDAPVQLIGRITPDFITDGVRRVREFFFSVMVSPLITLLGGWRTIASTEEESARSPGESCIREGSSVTDLPKPFYSTPLDLFRTEITHDLTKRIYKWQKGQSNTYFEKVN